ncbi:hypothetical protein N8529_00050 [bacterium]|nr:hypothetical protein [bacterium]
MKCFQSPLALCIIAIAFWNSACVSNNTKQVEIIKTKSGEKIRKSTENIWSPDARVIARKSYDNDWNLHQIVPGESTVISLSESHFLIGSFDGGSSDEITIQLPAPLKSGRVYSLRTIPSSRPATKVDEYDRVAAMRDGELTGFQFGNPRMAALRQAEIAKVTVLSVDGKTLIIHLRLKAKMDGGFGFEIDRDYRLKLKRPMEGATR